MADPFRLRVMKAVTAALKTVTVPNGFQNDLSDFTDAAGRTQTRVFRGRTVFGDTDPLPMVTILEDPKSAESDDSRMSVNSAGPWRLLIQGFVLDDPEHPLDPAYLMAADVIKALVNTKRGQGGNILGMAGKVMALSVGSPIHRPADGEVSSTAFFLLPITLTLVEDRENPFA